MIRLGSCNLEASSWLQVTTSKLETPSPAILFDLIRVRERVLLVWRVSISMASLMPEISERVPLSPGHSVASLLERPFERLFSKDSFLKSFVKTLSQRAAPDAVL